MLLFSTVAKSLFLFSFMRSASKEANPEVVRLDDGSLVQETNQHFSTVSGKKIFAFLGIPYGEAERFEKPQPVKPWTGVLVADKHIECFQYSTVPFWDVWGTEDCLVLHVYSKEVTKLKPVMVFIHGGSLITGAGTPRIYGPDILLEKDIVLVTLNFRLGVLGFMGLGNDVMPGNLGLWDQTLALKWIQKNIRHFGGDPNNITLFGLSSGGICIFYHLMSPQSKGLFHAVIIQSGSATLPYAKSDEHPSHYVKTMARYVGCEGHKDDVTLKKCLQQTPAKDLTLLGMKKFTSFIWLPYPFKPHLDNSTSDPFFPRDPLEILAEGTFTKVPVMIGTAKDDALIFSMNFEREPELFEKLEKNPKAILPLIMFNRGPDGATEEDYEKAKEIMPDISSEISIANVTEIFRRVYDPLHDLGVRMIAKGNPKSTFSYVYAHVGPLSLAEWTANHFSKNLLKVLAKRFFNLNLFSRSLGVCHGDELFLLFKPHVFNFDPRSTEGDFKTSNLITQIWTDFATYHNPTPFDLIWPPLDKDSNFDCIIGTGNLSLVERKHYKTDFQSLRLHDYKRDSWK